MKQEVKARLSRLDHVRDDDRVVSGSPVDLVLRPADARPHVLTISAVKALVRRGVVLLRAKRTVEAMVETGEAFVHVPTVEDVHVLAAGLRAAGVTAARVGAVQVDAKTVRAGLGLTQEQFALRFGLDIDAVQNWEQGRYPPDRATVAYLRAIAAAPREVAAAQEEALS
jgi:DNA-binding XRE family transcriptional regulator